MAGQVVFPFAQRPMGRMGRGAVAPLLPSAPPRVAPAAVRVPDPRHAQLDIAFPSGSPQIFVHEGARQALERRLAMAHNRPVAVAVTDNSRNMISYSHRNGVLKARIHHMFLDAPGVIQNALVRYILRSDREASHLVGRYIDENGHRIRATRPVLNALQTQGKHHDLLELYKSINEGYFDGSVEALITWGRRGKERRDGKRRRTIKLGSYSAVERLIRVHPVLDNPWVPRYFVAYIVYHEMLHHVIPSSHGTRRRMLHPPQFRARERAFKEFERSLAWEKTHIGRLLRA